MKNDRCFHAQQIAPRTDGVETNDDANGTNANPVDGSNENGQMFEEVETFAELKLRLKIKQIELNITRLELKNMHLENENKQLRAQLIDLGHKPSTQSSFVRLLTDQKACPKGAKNRFNPKDCHINLHIFKPNFVRVIFLGSEKAHRTVRAEFTMSQKSGISYFEVTIVRLQNMYESLIGVGMATKAMPLDTWIGEHRENYAYYDSGYIYGHSINYICGFPRYETGDVIGCGVNWATQEIIYTKNGERLDTANLYVLTTTDLYPAVTMYNPGDIVEANFGPIFQYNYISDN